MAQWDVFQVSWFDWTQRWATRLYSIPFAGLVDRQV